MQPIAPRLIGVVLATLFSAGCVGTTSYPVVEPITFKPSAVGLSPNAAVEVDSLTPTFKWKQPDQMAKYDFAVWYVGAGGAPGEIFHYEEETWGGQYTLQKPLSPGLEYFWSVKKSGTSEWATANYLGFSPIGAAWGKGLPFKIKAPAK